MTRIRSLGYTWWEGRTELSKLSPDLHTCAVASQLNLNYTKALLSWACGSVGRLPAQCTQSLGFNLQPHLKPGVAAHTWNPSSLDQEFKAISGYIVSLRQSWANRKEKDENITFHINIEYLVETCPKYCWCYQVSPENRSSHHWVAKSLPWISV